MAAPFTYPNERPTHAVEPPNAAKIRRRIEEMHVEAELSQHVPVMGRAKAVAMKKRQRGSANVQTLLDNVCCQALLDLRGHEQMINSGEAASHADGVVMLGHVGCVEARESMDGRGSWRRRWLRSGCKTVSVAKVKKGGG